MREGAIKGVYAISYDENQMALIQEENKTSASTVSLIIFILLGSALTLLVSAFYIQGIINRFRKLTQAIRAVGMKIDEVSIKIASSSQTLATGTAKQSSSIEQTDHAIKEIKTRISQTADNAKNSAHMSEVSQTKALAGQTTVDTMAQSILDINASNDAIMKQIDHSNQQLSEIVTVIQEIGNKTKVINDIVFQTKLLSFNASVEAARAGEHGKGFAVVAQEIGNLAQLSGTAAKQISDILSGSITKVESIVRDTKVKVEHLLSEGKQKVDYGTTIAKQCKETLEQIVHDVKEVSAMVNEISEASQEQAKGIGDVATSITELSHTTHQNSKTTEQTAEAAGSLAEQAQSLTSALDELERTIEGSFTSANLDQDFQNTLIGSQDRQPPRLKTLEKPSKKPNASVKSKPQVHSDHPDHNTAYDKFQAFPDKQDKNEAHSISHVTHVPAQQDHATPDRDNPDFEE
jgi:methyl-accepting chemotaxis protein